MRRAPLFFISLLSLVVLSTSCTKDRDIRDYYFPTKGLVKGMVYAYQPLSGPDKNLIYWHLLTTEQDGNYHLNTTTYGPDFTPTSLNTENLTNAGAVTKQVFLYATDSTGISNRTEAKILAGNVFPFTLPSSKEQPAYVYKIQATPPDDPEGEYRLTYNRQFSRDTMVQVLGGEYPAVVFSITGETDVRSANGESFAPTFEGYEIYAEGLGLVESYRDFGVVVFHQRLRERFPMTELQARARRAGFGQ